MDRLKMITSPDVDAQRRARERWDGVAKPLRSLGLLEEAVVKIAGMTGNENVDLTKRCAVVMCADNGVVSEGVTQTDSGVTAIVAKAMAGGTSNINALAKVYDADVIPVDMGMNTDVDGILSRKTARGTGNIAVGPAMSLLQAEQAVASGMDIVRNCREKGYKLIVTGEMGIGNTTTAAALGSVLLKLPPEKTVGRGAGLSNEGLMRKVDAVNRAIAVNKPDKARPMELLAKLGGFDIAGMTGLFLGGAVYKIPIVIDGVISAVAAALAAEIEPVARDYMLCSHVSKEPIGPEILKYLGLQPIITAAMSLGEGTGGIMLLPLLDGALAVYNSSHRFEKLPMERYVEQK